MKTFTLALDKDRIKVSGIEIIIPGYEEYRFILHRNITMGNIEGDVFTISEVTTGRNVGGYTDSDVIHLMDNVETKLKQIGKKKVKKVFNSYEILNP